VDAENKSNRLPMKSNTSRIIGYDFVRSFAIIAVFVVHISQWFGNIVVGPYHYSSNSYGFLGLALVTLVPVAMSLLGFISAALLTRKYLPPYDAHFFLGRFTRIYTSLFICLLFLSIYLTVLGKNIITHHTIYHYIGLTVFFDLFDVQNNSPLGSGLWFISVILILYLLLPFLAVLFTHRNGFIHLLGLIFCFICLYYTTYGILSTWNVVTSFSLGVYLGLNGKIQEFEGSRYIRLSIILAPLLLTICALATIEILPYKILGILFPFYSPAFIPLFFVLSHRLEKWKFAKPFIAMVVWFSGISYEFYILHFYFIRNYFVRLFPNIDSQILHILISFIIVCCISYLVAKLASIVRRNIMAYFLGKNVESSRNSSFAEIQIPSHQVTKS
jgi:peptidoglycan/LPS O-acetylase OafA/YrhL